MSAGRKWSEQAKIVAVTNIENVSRDDDGASNSAVHREKVAIGEGKTEETVQH
jgi:hypothetical protein